MEETKISRPQIPDFIESSLFTFLERAVLAEGGDGWGQLITKNYKELAELFDKWQDGWWTKEISENHISFTHEQEFILFTDTEDKPTNFYEVIIRWGIK